MLSAVVELVRVTGRLVRRELLAFARA
jgi:hypothetical protein